MFNSLGLSVLFKGNLNRWFHNEWKELALTHTKIYSEGQLIHDSSTSKGINMNMLEAWDIVSCMETHMSSQNACWSTL